MVKKSIRSRLAIVHGDDISPIEVTMQTGNHEGQECKVSKNVTIDYESPRPWKAQRKLDESTTDNTVKARSATVKAKEIRGPWQVDDGDHKGQKKIRAKNDVTIEYHDDVRDAPSSVSTRSRRRRKQ